MIHFLSTAAVFAAAAKTTTKSGNPAFLLVLVVIVFAGYFLFLRPQQQKAKKARAQGLTIEVGDEVLTVGGIVGRVLDLTDDRVTILTGESTDESGSPIGAPTRLLMVRQAIARKIEPVVEAEDDDDEEEEHDDWASSEEEHHEEPSSSEEEEGK